MSYPALVVAAALVMKSRRTIGFSACGRGYNDRRPETGNHCADARLRSKIESSAVRDAHPETV